MNKESNAIAATDNIVYVRPLGEHDLSEDVLEKIGDPRGIYAVHNSMGQRLALVKGRSLAFVLARQNDLAPVNVH